MLDSKGFDLWADGYDKSVGLAEADDRYPFAGYRDVLGEIYAQVMQRPGAAVLDIGFGTAVLTARLYESGCAVWGVDFSPRMLELARCKMPEAHLFQADFTQGLPEELLRRRYDFIVATYSLHHLPDDAKPAFFGALLPLLSPGGRILAGDVAFADRAALERCRQAAGEEWDDEEFYFVYDELAPRLPGRAAFRPVSHCAGVLTLEERPA